MVDRIFVSDFISLVVLLVAILFLKLNLFIVSIVVLILWYLLFGFIGLALILSLVRKVKLSKFFIVLTYPMFLLPLRKSFYYWVKSVNVILKDPSNVKLAYEYARKVNIDNLYTNNNKSNFYCYLANIHFDLNQKELGFEYLHMAKKIPHKALVEKNIQNLESIINKE